MPTDGLTELSLKAGDPGWLPLVAEAALFSASGERVLTRRYPKQPRSHMKRGHTSSGEWLLTLARRAVRKFVRLVGEVPVPTVNSLYI